MNQTRTEPIPFPRRPQRLVDAVRDLIQSHAGRAESMEDRRRRLDRKAEVERKAREAL